MSNPFDLTSSGPMPGMIDARRPLDDPDRESPAVELQTLIWGVLTDDARLMTLANGVYDFVPEPRRDIAGEENRPWGAMQGYVSFGPLDVTNDDAECIMAGQYTFQLDCWSRQKNSLHCRRMVDRIRTLLNNTAYPIADNAMVGMTIEAWRWMRDPDGLTTHGMVSVRAFVEDGGEDD